MENFGVAGASAATGCRMSEALELTWDHVDLRGRQATVYQKDRVREQRRERFVTLEPVTMQALLGLPERDGLVFRPARHNSKTLAEDGYLDTDRTGGGQIKTGWAGACARAALPGKWRDEKRPDRPSVRRRFVPDVTPHVMRHTFASWHYCVYRDIKRLMEDGGWERLEMVLRYTKRVPDVYRDEIAAWWAGRADLGLTQSLRAVA